MPVNQTIKNVIYQGYGITSNIIGESYEIFRSPTPLNPLAPANYILTQTASYNVSWDYEKANRYGNAVFQTLTDGRYCAVGDYFFFNIEIYFLIARQWMLPLLSVQCNKIIKIERASTDNAPDSDVYSGYNSTPPLILAESLPASILFSNKGIRNEQKLPTDTYLGFWTILIPDLGGVVYKNRDIIQDATNFRYVVDTAELTVYGWRIMAQQLGT